MAEIVGKEFAALKTGDQAEEATLAVIEKAGHAILQAWASRRAEAVTADYKPEKGVRPNRKKSRLANNPRADCCDSIVLSPSKISHATCSSHQAF